MGLRRALRYGTADDEADEGGRFIEALSKVYDVAPNDQLVNTTLDEAVAAADAEDTNTQP